MRRGPAAASLGLVLLAVPGGAASADPPCASDPFEPDDTPATAFFLGAIRDDAAFPSGSLTAAIEPPGDVDWYRYTVEDRLLGIVAPRVELDGLAKGEDADVCVYYVCATGEAADLDCDLGVADERAGHPGCCGRNRGTTPDRVHFDALCGTSPFDDDGGTVLVVVERISGTARCAPYTLRWGDD